MTVPNDLASELSATREQLDRLDVRRAELISLRDHLIVRACTQGGSLREVAELVGLRHTAVRHILIRDTRAGDDGADGPPA